MKVTEHDVRGLSRRLLCWRGGLYLKEFEQVRVQGLHSANYLVMQIPGPLNGAGKMDHLPILESFDW